MNELMTPLIMLRVYLLSLLMTVPLLNVGLFAASDPSQPIQIENVKIRQIEAQKFTRISEYFTGKENTGRRVFLRTDPDARGGLYFIIRLGDQLTALPQDLLVGVDLYESGSALLKQHRFMLPNDRKRTNQLFIGITGDEFLKKELPVAWRVYFEYLGGESYSEYKSYLWEMPTRVDP